MKFILAASALALATAVQAAPTMSGCHAHACITQAQADQFITRYSAMLEHQDSDIGNFTETADLLLASNFQEISGSINSLAGLPLDAVTTPTKADYINALTYGPADAGINTIFTSIANCRNVVWHWEFTGSGSGKYPVKGFNYFQFNKNCRVETQNLEFNSIAWGSDIGFAIAYPNGTTIPN